MLLLGKDPADIVGFCNRAFGVKLLCFHCPPQGSGFCSWLAWSCHLLGSEGADEPSCGGVLWRSGTTNDTVSSDPSVPVGTSLAGSAFVDLALTYA